MEWRINRLINKDGLNRFIGVRCENENLRCLMHEKDERRYLIVNSQQTPENVNFVDWVH